MPADHRSRVVYLVRHGEVENPDHLVYADLPGFGLSSVGRRQAEDLARHLADRPVCSIVTSPLQRAVETARPLATRLRLEPVVEPDLTEWLLARRWAGVRWEALPERFPGELEAYLEHPAELPFAPESLARLADRVVTAIDRHIEGTAGPVVFVSHQDPVQAARLRLTGRPLEHLHDDKPAHGTVIRLESGSEGGWVETERWDPDQGATFPPTAR